MTQPENALLYPCASALRVAIVLLTLIFAGPNRAQYQVQNGGFASNLSGWQELQLPIAQAAWSSADSNNTANSGSVFVLNFSTVAANTVATVLRQCIALIGPGRHIAMAAALTPSTAVAGSITARLVIRPSSECTGNASGVVAIAFQTPSSFWQRDVEYFDVPIAASGLYSVEVLFDVHKIPADGSYGGFFDDIAVDSIVLDDGFESGLLP